MKPLFEVGERVILQSRLHPRYNGEYTVKAIVKHGHIYKGQTVFCVTKDQWHYDLGFLAEDFKVFAVWAEMSLRKKHKPSELSFNEMMNTFKIKEKL